MTETHRVRDLAELVAGLAGAKVAVLPNPRKEAAENDLVVHNEQFLELGLQPITLEKGLLAEVVDVARNTPTGSTAAACRRSPPGPRTSPRRSSAIRKAGA